MLTREIVRVLWAVLCIMGAAVQASGQATSPSLEIKTIAEVTVRVGESGRETRKLAPAVRVVPGDEVIYTLEIRNAGPADVAAPTVARPVPEHMVFLADSATGPGAEVTFSVDGGHTFDRPENLKVTAADGHVRTALAKEYTHIQWQFKTKLKSKSVAFARFRAVVK